MRSARPSPSPSSGNPRVRHGRSFSAMRAHAVASPTPSGRTIVRRTPFKRVSLPALRAPSLRHSLAPLSPQRRLADRKRCAVTGTKYLKRPGCNAKVDQGALRHWPCPGQEVPHEDPAPRLDDYLVLRQAMGFKLSEARTLLPQFVDFLRRSRSHIHHHGMAVEWQPTPSYPTRRMGKPPTLGCVDLHATTAAHRPRTAIPPAALLPTVLSVTRPYSTAMPRLSAS